MSSYYYLMAQLPAILPLAPLAVSYKSFKETASRFLTKNDLNVLLSLSLEPPKNIPVSDQTLVDKWYTRERALRLSLSRFRASKLKREWSLSPQEQDAITYGFTSMQAAKTASGFDNPLEAEEFLDKIRFSWIVELQGNHFFDSDAVFAYALMLLLHERSDRFTTEAGRASYNTIYTQILGEQA